MIRHTLLAAALAMTASASFAAETPAPAAAPLTLGEQFIVRAYAGQMEATALTQIIKAKSVGIAVNNSTICVSLAGSMAGALVSHYKGEAPKTGEKAERRLDIAALNSPDDATQATAQLMDMDAIALLFGGQVSAEDNAASVKGIMQELAKAEYKGAIFLHLTVAGKKWVEMAAAEDSTVAAYLANKTNVYALGVNPEQKKGMINLISFKDGKQAVAKTEMEAPLSANFLELFKRR